MDRNGQTQTEETTMKEQGATRLKVATVENVEVRTTSTGKRYQAHFCQGEVGGEAGRRFCVKCWEDERGKFADAGRVFPGAELEGRQSEKKPKEDGVDGFSLMPEKKWGRGRQRGGHGSDATGQLASVFREWMGEWMADRAEARAMERERFEFERKARVLELTLAALAQCHKDMAEFSKVRARVEEFLK